MSFQPDRERLAWAAGFFDGEGTVCLSQTRPSRAHRIQMTIHQAEPYGEALLKRFQTAVGGLGGVTGPYRNGHTNPSHKSTWFYQVYGFERVQAIIAMLWSFLGPAKREQARCALSKFAAKES